MAKVAIFTTNVDAENQCLVNHKCVCGALNRHFFQTRVISWPSVHRPCKPLTLLSCRVIKGWLCGRVFFIFRRGGDFFNSILSGWERCNLFCKLWSVLGLVLVANVLTPVRWLFSLHFNFSKFPLLLCINK